MNDTAGAWSVDELAGLSGLPVRTIREYQSMKLLDPPDRRGRVGVYRAQHLARLRLIGRLQGRGYSLAGIRDLLHAWAAGSDLMQLLHGDEPAMIDEPASIVSRTELTATLPAFDSEALARLTELGIISDNGNDQVCVAAPSLLLLLGDATTHGLPVADALRLAAGLSAGVDQIVTVISELLRDSFADARGDEASLQFLRRGRGLLAQGTARLLILKLGAELAPSDSEQPGDGLHDVVDALRIGSVTAGTADELSRKATP
jgi:DNA-binding transcriptional MerR regulator